MAEDEVPAPSCSGTHGDQAHKEPPQLTQAENTAFANAEKEIGNVAFQAKEWQRAIDRYEYGLKYVLYHNGHSGEPLGEDDTKVAVALLSNCAAAQLKLGHHELAVTACTQALCLDMLNVKVYFRRAQALLALGRHDVASEDALRILDLEPSNREAEQLRLKIAADAKRTKQKDKAFCSKMFG
eukprot:gnl/TRDRNA2_/TRDRNA2_27766_c0_seq1.p1 gnl/TRDRNA2_/TRDRNA2_27766_c0~~gnl/TRDRNA2_/TRDRNA2_27766_c0_seq1.p1  ORF type:complete len:183 (+),score=42.49 gnl/TRDRNA2_/TRDRNA2_27766_c0_seq1:115-663(+)